RRLELLLIGLLVTGGSAVLIAILPALGSAVQIGPDEHFEVTKAALWARGVALYDPVWNDQPPLYTVLLGIVFRCFGIGIAGARAVAVLFGFLFLSGCFVLVRRRCGVVAACAA